MLDLADYLNFIKKAGLNWDLHEEFNAMVDDPITFKKEFHRIQSPMVYRILFEDPSEAPLYLESSYLWLKFTSEWVLSQNVNIDSSS